MLEYEEKGSSFGTVTVLLYPSGLQRLSLEDLKKMVEEADELLKKGDYVQACEKFYKVTEEIIKTLAEIYAPNTLAKVKKRYSKKRNPWDTGLLYEASAEISENLGGDLGEMVRRGWRSGFDLHRDCFHEFLMTPHDINDAISDVKTLFKLAKDIIQKWNINTMSFATINMPQKPITVETEEQALKSIISTYIQGINNLKILVY